MPEQVREVRFTAQALMEDLDAVAELYEHFAKRDGQALVDRAARLRALAASLAGVTAAQAHIAREIIDEIPYVGSPEGNAALDAVLALLAQLSRSEGEK